MERADVVILGAGSAGCVLAARLSERPDLSVLLLEAGPDHRREETPPAIAGPSFVQAMAEPERSWPDLLVRHTAEQPLRLYARGRGTGGSSAINAMVALPGEPGDYDAWERDHGCTGWGWADVEPWFRRTAVVLHRAPRHVWGPVNLALAAAEPSAADGVPLTRDGAGRRVSAADAYLEPARGRRNLTVRGGAHVDRVLMEGRRAVGARLADGTEIEAATVIVCAGAIHSPAILLRSRVDVDGIGDGLQDHPSMPFGIRLHDAPAPGTLPIATTAILSSSLGERDLQLLPIDRADPATPEMGLLMAAVMEVRSRGRVRVTSEDPLVQPDVDMDMLTDDRDVTLMMDAIAAAQRTLAHEAFARIGEASPVDTSPEGIRAALGDYVHATSTCAMGRVVDTAARVLGHEGLLVCDASIMPAVPRANTHLPTVVVAERIAARWRDALPTG